LTYSGWLTHISGHPSATSRAQDSERTPAKDRCSTAGPHNQAKDYEILKYALLQRFNLTEEGFKQKFKSTRAEI